MIFTGSTEYDRMKSPQFNILGEALQIKLRESLREDAGGVYGAWVNTSISKYPEGRYSVSVVFCFSPDNVEKLTGLVPQELRASMEHGTLKSDLDMVLKYEKHRVGK